MTEEQFEIERDRQAFTHDNFILTDIVRNYSTRPRRNELNAVKPGEFGIVTVDYEDCESEFAIIHRLPVRYSDTPFQVSYFSMLGPLPVIFKSESNAKEFLDYVQDKYIFLNKITAPEIPSKELVSHAREMYKIFKKNNY